MRTSRRKFIQSSSAVAAGFFGLRSFIYPQYGAAAEQTPVGYGRLYTDPDGVLDLPDGFTYKIISKVGSTMDDGLLLPGAPDGMATFPGPFGLTLLIRNHELTPDNTGPFGEERELASKVDKSKLYDAGKGETPGSGGTTTVVYDTRRQQVVREFMSLAGTIRNCAGGPTPWNSWVTCEETVDRAGDHREDPPSEPPAGRRRRGGRGFGRRGRGGRGPAAERPRPAADQEQNENEAELPIKYRLEKDHGYNFEVPATANASLADPVPLIDMGRFNHEAIAVDPKSGAVYETEDRDDGLIYRFLPKKPKQLAEGGKLQALKISEKDSWDTRNWGEDDEFPVGQSFAVEWFDVDEVTSPEDDLRARGFDAGAARFARGEGMWYGNDSIYFACTSGGEAKAGQIWRYTPSPVEGWFRENQQPGKLELFIESPEDRLLKSADNLTVAPWGDLFVCEDRSGEVVRIVGVTPQGKLFTFAHNHLNSEFAGVTFSPDGTTLFVNIQGKGWTFAITGPWGAKQA